MTGRLPEALMYHYVRDAADPPRVRYPAMDLATFDAQLDQICRTRTPVTWGAVHESLAGGRSLPSDAILLTFDDGLADHHRHVLPRLVGRGLAATFFVLAREPRDGLAIGHALHVIAAAIGPERLREHVLARLEPADAKRYLELEAGLRAMSPADADDPWKRPLQRELEASAGPILADLVSLHVGPEPDVARQLYLSRGQLVELVANGMTLGGHGRDHPWLDAVGGPRRHREIAVSAELLTLLLPGPWPFAYPYGGVPPRPARLLAGAGFAAAFTTRADERHDRFRIGRHDADELGATGLPPVVPPRRAHDRLATAIA
jgi:peptidoglycan/xylan/chitin deacetylase (PgdA/CDA1 family)